MLPLVSLVVQVLGGVSFARYATYAKQLVDTAVTAPYMDEIFHVPQAAQLCRGAWAPDPKVTTPPGLYWLALLYQRLGTVLGWDVDCTRLESLRTVSFAGVMVLPFLTDMCLNQTLVSLSAYAPLYRTLVGFAIATIPPLFFFGFLYYTDVASTVLVYTALTLADAHQHFFASVVGLIAMTVRQNNVVWVAFMLGQALLAELRRQTPNLAWSRVPPLSTLLAQRRVWLALAEIAAAYVPTLAAFAAFVVWNGGELALGDKAHHQLAVHVPQLGYFFAFATFFGWPALLPVLGRVRVGRRGLLALGALTLAGLVAVHAATYVHPFLLADNRHYMFYVWRRVINAAPWTRYALVPLYVASH
ncbi:dolichyl-P-Glc:Glc2Man9GlcNAc2-PP-dolichol alpha-1,2-glucosyltransferase [Malassezia obtusa]|uniref:Dol-P-Glc:Glc(2)Man(9)GlcNAc(2)-PP-Dol alpha-1,2-glucosyltransferase n=1 Tax=Malassezia obtusa TaxID=76774 RepID=A0AAF0IS44_9BASI|nr:dolichyl-P-Glc:Glc2Man9GlcNAc2-PP-dolichol alpha-1,2-glucosyltransferase [Malassezia obtusa]